MSNHLDHYEMIAVDDLRGRQGMAAAATVDFRSCVVLGEGTGGVEAAFFGG